MPDPAVVPEDAARVRQIFRYLAEVGGTRTKPVRHDDGARHTLWFDELPPQFQNFVREPISGDRPLWLRAERPLRSAPPLPPQPLALWLDAALVHDSDPEDAPRLRATAELAVSETTPDGSTLSSIRTVPLDEYQRRDEVKAQYGEWAELWTGWARYDRAVKPVVRAYDRLYRVHEDVSDLGESYELLLGLGHLAWQSGDEPVRRHLVTCRAVIALDTDSGAITVAPDPEHGAFALDESMLDSDQKARAHTRELVLKDLEAAGDATEPEGRDLLHRALNTWVIAAHQSGEYIPEPDRPGRSAHGDAPVVRFAPVLLLRERTRRSMQEALQNVARLIENGAEPTRLLRAIAGTDDSAGFDGSGRPHDPDGSGTGTPPQELYFALPSNDEQRTIAERLRDRSLVVVQGPPGTGKTHTIANLVTDLLAHGQRVLITSHTSRALRVLKEKLPLSVRELCVSRTDELTAQQELEQSVKAILDRQGEFSPRDYRRRIQDHEEKLRTARSVQAGALKELRAIRERETYRHPADIGDYQGTLAQIASRLHDERPVHDWIGTVPGPEPVVSADAVAGLRRAALAFTARHRALAASVSAKLPTVQQLLSGPEFAEAVTAVREAEADLAALRATPQSSALDGHVAGLPVDRQEGLAQALEDFLTAMAESAQERAPWFTALRQETLDGREHEARAQSDRSHAALEAALQAMDSCGNALVSGLEKLTVADALGLATTLRDGLAAGERLRGPLGLKTRLRKAVGDFPETVKVDGQTVQTQEAAETVLQRVRLERHLQDTEEEYGTPEPWQSPSRRLARLRQHVQALETLVALADRRAALVRSASGSPAFAGLAWQHDEPRSTVAALLRAHAASRRAAAPRRSLADTTAVLGAAALQRGVPSAVERARRAAEEQDVRAYAEAVGELEELREALARKHACDLAYSVVADRLPELADQLEAEAESPVWGGRLRRYEEAWAWSAWCTRMEELTDPAAEKRTLARLAQADADIRIGLERLAADKAWYGCLSRLTDDQAVALTSYQQSVKRLGKGTGKYAHQYRQQARESLRASQEAVPAWIMPLHAVTDTVPMDRAGRFDVVIIDEASQSGPEALLLAWLGAKIVVVGDDKQVSPANVGIDHDELFAVQRRVLGGLPDFRRNLFAPTASFFDIASGLAGGRGRLMLREHFRCMPEIIGFSNELCYGGKLQPLRQYGADRLPPLRPVHVADGYVEGTGQRQANPPEAERLVEEVVRCIQDPAYAGRTMGVITLLGNGQKFRIEDLLADRVPLDERQRRRLRVGSAEEFQGDERDVVFVSTVASLTGPDGPRRIGSYSSTLYQQHINVAASRARDQVWLFHSVTLTELAESDLRRRYLDWFSRPAEQLDGLGLGDVTEDEPHDAFDSLFEQRVFLALRRRGYRVRPQYPAGRYRIDLVVEGGTRRLAVECDGDAFHTEENADADAARQRELERVGWTFVRIRGSRFFFDPDLALEPLWAELDRLGIERTADGRPGPETVGVPSPAQDRETAAPAVAPTATPAGGPQVPAPVQVPTQTPAPATATVPVQVPTRAPAPAPATTPVQVPAQAQAPAPVAAEPQDRAEPRKRSGEAVWTTDPAGFRTVAWLRRGEVNAAQHSFSMRRTVPNAEERRSKARFLPGAGPSGGDVVEVVREGEPLARLDHDEVQGLIRAGIAKTDVPVLRAGHQTALVRYHDRRTPEAASHGSSTELMRPVAEPVPQGRAETPAPPVAPVAPAAPAVPGAPVEKPTAEPGRRPAEERIRIRRLSVKAYQRVQRELDRIRDELERPEPEIIAVDSASWRSQQAAREQLLDTLHDRKDFLRALLDEAELDPRAGGRHVTPGCLVGVEHSGATGVTTYEIALRAGGDAERLSPYTPLGQALMWREAGDTVEWRSADDRAHSAIIRRVED
ncbi:AAA domain-containing protein [Streptomyces filamentosus]|uniref:AAA domain-containing protein n=1 Tax=Streptomyces filamentosus TaxID=67294 RepID=UPI0037D4B237